MASKVGFSEQVQPGDAARLRELVPHRLADNAKTEIADHSFAHAAKRFNIAKTFRRTTLRVHQPLGAKIHDDVELSLEFDRWKRLRKRYVYGDER
jgi:hypothetical protein